MATKTKKTSDLADHLQKTLDMVMEVKADTGAIASDPSAAASSLTDAFNGKFDVDLSGLGDVEKVYELSVTPSTGTATITSTVSASDKLTLSVDSSVNLSIASADFVIHAVVKRKL